MHFTGVNTLSAARTWPVTFGTPLATVIASSVQPRWTAAGEQQVLSSSCLSPTPTPRAPHSGYCPQDADGVPSRGDTVLLDLSVTSSDAFIPQPWCDRPTRCPNRTPTLDLDVSTYPLTTMGLGHGNDKPNLNAWSEPEDEDDNSVDLSTLTTYPKGKMVYWRPGLYNGDKSPEHNFGLLPNFTPEYLKSQRPTIPYPGQRLPGPGLMPPRVKRRRYHDRMHFYHPGGYQHHTQRDLGFSSVLDGRIVWTFGDTLMGYEEHALICAPGASSIGTKDAPMVLMDTKMQPNGFAIQTFIDCLPEEELQGGLVNHAFFGTNIVEVAPNHGIVYFVKNYRPGNVDHYVGAGVATVFMGDNNVPQTQRTVEKMWEGTEPYWGDVGICLDPRNDNIYVWGHGPLWDEAVGSRTYLARVNKHSAQNVSAYEYWHNDTQRWEKQRIGDGTSGTVRVTPEMAVFDWHQMNQAAPFWSNHFNKWIWIHGSHWPNTNVMLMTADQLEGPWEHHQAVASTKPRGHRDGFRYAVAGHPEYDDTGKTVFVTWTINNSVWGMTIEWE